MNLRNGFEEDVKKPILKWEIIEQDYLLSLILESISQIAELKNNVIFKGGTAFEKNVFW